MSILTGYKFVLVAVKMYPISLITGAEAATYRERLCTE